MGKRILTLEVAEYDDGNWQVVVIDEYGKVSAAHISEYLISDKLTAEQKKWLAEYLASVANTWLHKRTEK